MVYTVNVYAYLRRGYSLFIAGSNNSPLILITVANTFYKRQSLSIARSKLSKLAH